ncbi:MULTISPECIES: ABC transporter permease [unclassified Neglectibacter]|uniref:ABC transporter permease n=1 Tax=unclassified Neglectibacter TaxID=2632164 RepID=UPI00136FD4AE|nr:MULTISPECIES: ABC transporter permease [unclassified Neglectibacter]
MNFVKRAFLYCFRQKVKTLILFLVLAIISTFLLTGLAIRDASEGATADVQTAIGGKLFLEIDPINQYDSSQDGYGMTYTYNGDYITAEILDVISKVDGVVDFNSDNPRGFWGAGVDFEYLPAAFNLSYTPYGESSAYTAALSSEKSSDFESGKYSLVDGRHITPEDKYVVMISKELADYNKLSVGDVMTMYCLDSDSNVELKIIGIFDGTEGTSGNGGFSVSDIPANCGYVDYTTMFENFGRKIDGYTQIDIYVEDPVSIQNVYDKVKDLPEFRGKSLKLSIDTDEYEVVQAPLETLQSLVNTIIVIIIVVSSLVLTLLLTLWIRGRKKEIGVYLSIGKNKTSIIGQFFVETVTVAIVAFATSVFFGSLIAGKASEFLVSRVTTGAATLHVEISAAYLLPVYLIGIAIIAIAVVLASWTVFRLKPRDILSKMS